MRVPVAGFARIQPVRELTPIRLNSCEFSYDGNATRSWIRKNSAGAGVDADSPELLRVQLRWKRDA